MSDAAIAMQTVILTSEIDEDSILRLTLNDVGRRNALSEAIPTRLATAFAEVSANPGVRVVVLAANGPAFCAGHHLKEMTASRRAPDRGRAGFTRVMSMCSRVMQAIVACTKPVIAEVAGVATAEDCQLVDSCDLALAGESVQFATPGVNIGLFCSTPMAAPSRNVSNKHAMEMPLAGGTIPADGAAEIGLVNRVVPSDAVRETAMELARRIASKSSLTLATGRRAFYEQREMILSQTYEYASNVMVENMLAQDAEEGIGAFIEKRAPQWRDA